MKYFSAKEPPPGSPHSMYQLQDQQDLAVAARHQQGRLAHLQRVRPLREAARHQPASRHAQGHSAASQAQNPGTRSPEEAENIQESEAGAPRPACHWLAFSDTSDTVFHPLPGGGGGGREPHPRPQQPRLPPLAGGRVPGTRAAAAAGRGGT